MAEAIRLLDDVTQQLTPVPPVLEGGAGGDLGPAGITPAAEELAARWAERTRAAQDQAADALAGLRAARHHYRSADEEASSRLDRFSDGA